MRTLVVPILLAVASSSRSQSLDFARSDFPAGDGPRAVAAADFDQDALPDLAVADEGSNRAMLLLGQGGGSLGAPQFAGSLGAAPRGLVDADLNGDAWPDLASASFGTASISLLLNATGGAFAPLASTPVLPDPLWVVAADLDADGDIDLATPNFDQSSVSVVLGNGDGTFAPVLAVPLIGALSGVHMDTSDLDLDGDTDLCVGVISSFSYLSLMNDGTGASWTGVHTQLGLGSAAWVSAGPLDGDAFPDLVITADDLGDEEAALFHGTGTGAVTGFPTPAVYEFGTCCTKDVHELGDLDADGKLDVVIAQAELTSSGSLPKWLRVFRSTGSTPMFQASQASMPGRALDLALTDLDLDGKLDVAAACTDFDELAVFLQRAPILPTVAITIPASAVSLQLTAQPLELLGSGFTTLQAYKLDGVLKFGMSGLVVHDDTRATVALPTPVGAGAHLAIELVNAAGTGFALVPLVAPAQPIVYAQIKFSKGTPLPDLHLGAGAGDLAWLGGSLELLPSTLPGVVDLAIGDGFTSLVFLGGHVIPPVGWKAVDLPLGGLHIGTPLHFQMAVLPLGGSLPLVSSNVVSGTLGF